MSLKNMLFLALIAFSFAGCISTSTPENTVTSAKDTLESGDLDGFRGLLIGRAKAEFGREPIFEGLRGYLKRFDGLDVVRTDLMVERKISEIEFHSGHLILVKSGRTVVLEVGVTCVDRFDFAGRAPKDTDILPGLNDLQWDTGRESRSIGRVILDGKEWTNICRIHSIVIK